MDQNTKVKLIKPKPNRKNLIRDTKPCDKTSKRQIKSKSDFLDNVSIEEIKNDFDDLLAIDEISSVMSNCKSNKTSENSKLKKVRRWPDVLYSEQKIDERLKELDEFWAQLNKNTNMPENINARQAENIRVPKMQPGYNIDKIKSPNI